MTTYIVHDGSGTVLDVGECRYVYRPIDEEYDEDAILASEDNHQWVWVLHISHRHDDDISVHATFESAWRAVVDWCSMYWDHDAAINIHSDDPVPFPEEDEQAIINGYFDGNEYEFYEIEQRMVQP